VLLFFLKNKGRCLIPPHSKSHKNNNNNHKDSGFNQRLNWDIKSKEVRVISAENEQLGILSLEQAIKTAEEDGFDLVEVAPNEKPPVCKIMDFGKFKYRAGKKKSKNIAASAKSVLKELRLRPKTEEHDIQVKVGQALKFLEKGHKVLFTIMFKGREIRYQDNGKLVLARVLELLEGFAKVEKPVSRIDMRKMQMTVAPMNASSPSSSSPSSPPPSPANTSSTSPPSEELE
jgi:translation initiation factor IF-3